MGEVRNDEYFKRCNGLHYLLNTAFMDKSLLKMNDSIRADRIALKKQNSDILQHLCNLIKRDLALTIWKIYIDDDEKANTIKKLNSFVSKLGNRPKVSIKLSSKYKRVCKDITQMRNTSLSHADWCGSNSTIIINDLFGILDEIKNMYNSMCDITLDDRVQQLEKRDIDAIDFKAFGGFLPMLLSSAVEKPDKFVNEEITNA